MARVCTVTAVQALPVSIGKGGGKKKKVFVTYGNIRRQTQALINYKG